MKILHKGLQRRIYECVKHGAETLRDVEADLNFTVDRILIRGHLSNLKQAGRLRVIGHVLVRSERRYGPDDVRSGQVRANRYAVTEGAV